jgi:hypothetical protein
MPKEVSLVHFSVVLVTAGSHLPGDICNLDSRTCKMQGKRLLDEHLENHFNSFLILFGAWKCMVQALKSWVILDNLFFNGPQFPHLLK